MACHCALVAVRDIHPANLGTHDFSTDRECTSSGDVGGAWLSSSRTYNSTSAQCTRSSGDLPPSRSTLTLGDTPLNMQSRSHS